MNGDLVRASFSRTVDMASQLSENTTAYVVVHMDDKGLAYHTNGDIYTVLGVLESLVFNIKSELCKSEEDCSDE